MKRRALLVAAIVLGATSCGRNRALRMPFFDVVRNARERAKTLAVRHRDVLAGTTHDPLAGPCEMKLDARSQSRSQSRPALSAALSFLEHYYVEIYVIDNSNCLAIGRAEY